MARRAAVVLVLAATSIAQGPPHNGPRPVDAGWFALQHARVVQAPGKVLEGATVVVRDGRITAVGRDAPPPGAVAIDCTGLTLYPGLIEPFFASDVPALDPATADQHWNPMVQPQRRALDGALVGKADREQLRALGFAVVAAAPSGGVLKGTSAVVLLDEPEPTAPARVLRTDAYAVASLQTRGDGYPQSEMGAIALLRQLLADASWYERCQKTIAARAELAAKAPQSSGVLQALVEQQHLPLWFDCQDELQALRVLKIAAESGRAPVIVGSGMEFRRLAALAAAKVPIVVPLFFPDAPDVSTESAATRVSLRQLQSWEQAPTNSKRLLDAGVTVAWTTARLRDRKELPAKVREAMACGVTADQALAALTTVPAGLLGIGAHAGTIERGKLANLIVADGELFAEKTTVREVWVGGTRHAVAPAKDQGLDGTWTWTGGVPGPDAAAAAVLTVDGDDVTCRVGDAKLKVAGVQRDAHTLTCRLSGKELGEGVFWLRAHRDGDRLFGTCTTPDGRALELGATRSSAVAAAKDAPRDGEKTGEKDEKKADEKPPPPAVVPLATPLGGYGFVEPPAASAFAIVGATVWPCDGRPPIANGAVVVQDGRIVFAGPRGDMPALPGGAASIDGTGKHATPGMIDCHSHTGISRGVNEGGQAVTAEVRIEDVLDPDDVNWYRQLAGGVTMVHQLHGSANVIGGQSSVTKARWGVVVPDDMHFAQPVAAGEPRPPTGMKWALGENPRRANGSAANPRYPNTRMGVEALIRDRLAAAEVYRREHALYERLGATERAAVLPPRRDLELDALAEILAGTRFIHCHSYRQDEIFMLCGIAKDHGIRIGTFQHVLEGYKVADAIAATAHGASSFSDWWAYKFEVYDAIPDNGAILHAAGAVVSFNSDSNEHARRLNTEAGKAVKYGGLAAHDALCFVTRNPAMQLQVFDRVGSLTAGKDADLALWSADPLGYAARCEATWVDGRQLFSLERDAAARAHIASERHRLVQRALLAGKGRTARDGDPKDAYWAAEDQHDDYCCRDAGGRR